MKKIDNHEIIGKAVKELDKCNFQDNKYFFSQQKHLLLGLSILSLFIFLTGTVWSLKHETTILKSKVSQLNEENASFKEQISIQTNQLPDNEFIYHEIQEGECFETISKRYYGTENYASKLALLNNMTVDTILNIGQIIKVPKESDMLK